MKMHLANEQFLEVMVFFTLFYSFLIVGSKITHYKWKCETDLWRIYCSDHFACLTKHVFSCYLWFSLFNSILCICQSGSMTKRMILVGKSRQVLIFFCQSIKKWRGEKKERSNNKGVGFFFGFLTLNIEKENTLIFS